MVEATANVDALPIETRRIAQRRKSASFFVAIGLAFFAVAVLGFGPHIRAFIRGTFPIAAIAHVHGALMTTWLLVFIVQAVLAARRRLDLHRKLGRVAAWLGAVVWISVVGLTVRGYLDTRYPLSENIFYSLPQL